MYSLYELRRQKRQLWEALDNLNRLKSSSTPTQQFVTRLAREFEFLVGLQEGLYIMAGKARKPNKTGNWEGFAKLPMSVEEKERFSSWDVEDEDVWILLADVILSGYKMSLSYSEQSQSWICALTCRDAESPNAGLTMSGFAATWYQALRVTLYKHVVMANYNWTTAVVAPLGEIG